MRDQSYASYPGGPFDVGAYSIYSDAIEPYYVAAREQFAHLVGQFAHADA